MAGTWNLFKRILQKKTEEHKVENRLITQRIDYNLPLNLRIGALVEVSQTDFILGGSNLHIMYPEIKNSVKSMGKFSIGESTAYSFYLGVKDTVYTLQVVVDSKKSIEECKLFMPYDEMFPSPEAGEWWNYWLDDNTGYIGYSVFELTDKTQYDRVWQDPSSQVELDGGLNRIHPIAFTEKIYLDEYGDSTTEIKHNAMLYGRYATDDVSEYLLVTAVESTESDSVQLLVGIEVNPTSLTVF
jgi:hypothetical protein